MLAQIMKSFCFILANWDICFVAIYIVKNMIAIAYILKLSLCSKLVQEEYIPILRTK